MLGLPLSGSHEAVAQCAHLVMVALGAPCLALDHGALLAGDGDASRSTPVAELEIELKDGEPRASMDVTAQQVLTAYHVTRKRNAIQPERAAPERDRRFDAWEAGQ